MKIELRYSLKFKRLCARTGLPAPQAAGLLEFLWHYGYEAASEVVGDRVDVEVASEWWGEPGVWADALIAERFLDVLEDGRLAVHDFWDHAPQFVSRKAKRKADIRSSTATIRLVNAQPVTSQRLAKTTQIGNGDEPNEHTPSRPVPSRPENAPDKPASRCNDEHGKRQSDDPPGFVRWWDAYPRGRKAGREKCLAVWRKRRLEAIASEVQAGLVRWIASHDWTKEGGQYVKAPLPWLNDSKWEAHPSPAKRGDAADEEWKIVDPTPEEVARMFAEDSFK